jgi:hypothetical protein
LRSAPALDVSGRVGLLDDLEELATTHGRFDPQQRERHLGDLRTVLDRARAVYRAVGR